MQSIIDYWDRRPCNIRHSTKPFLSKEYFDEVEKRKYFVESHIPEFADFAKWKGKKVLEIGCGIGTDAVNFAKNGAIYTGLDISAESLKITQERFKIYGLSGTFYNLDAQNIDLKQVGTNFDLIYSFGVIHHSPNPEQIINNCINLLADNGCLKLMVYAKNSWKNIMIQGGLDQHEAQSNCPVAYTYTINDLRDILTKSGFKNIDILQTHIFPYKVEKYIKYEYEVEDWFKCMNKEMFELLESKLGWHLCVTCYK